MNQEKKVKIWKKNDNNKNRKNQTIRNIYRNKQEERLSEGLKNNPSVLNQARSECNQDGYR